ncbi:hypothetical protein LBMAG48_24770 [Phycisphaerae bacterium]|nr:hypothetical protein LBMAG48_24770 [Phycisphaerae bacterium]
MRFGAALGLGVLLGLERERKNRPVGFRTMILINLGSAGLMLAGQEAIRLGATGPLSSADISLVLQGLMGGIGFLGAGAVIQNKKAVRGLTAAALFTLVILELFEDKYFPDQRENDRKQAENGEHGETIRIALDGNGKPVPK